MTSQSDGCHMTLWLYCMHTCVYVTQHAVCTAGIWSCGLLAAYCLVCLCHGRRTHCSMCAIGVLWWCLLSGPVTVVRQQGVDLAVRVVLVSSVVGRDRNQSALFVQHWQLHVTCSVGLPCRLCTAVVSVRRM